MRIQSLSCSNGDHNLHEDESAGRDRKIPPRMKENVKPAQIDIHDRGRSSLQDSTHGLEIYKNRKLKNRRKGKIEMEEG